MATAPSPKAEKTGFLSSIQTNPSSKKHNGRWRAWARWFFLDSWALECIAMIIAVAALLAIAITLIVYNGKPLDDWPYSIQLNTVLSTLATTMKGFLLMPVCASVSQLKWLWYTRGPRSLYDFQLFELATRGPWGAAQLLYRLRFWHMASIGSLVILLSLASDAFVQQTVSYPLRTSPQASGLPTIPYIQYFNQSDQTETGARYTTQPLMAALYNGVFSRNLTASTSSVTSNCPSGNCTFPSYASLAVCSTCEDVTSLLEYTSREHRLGGTYRYSLPNGHAFISAQTSVALLNITSGTTSIVLSGRSLLLNSETLAPYVSVASIANISVIASAKEGPHAYDCVLSFCAKSYKATETFNVFEETTLDVFDKLKPTISHKKRPEYNETITFDLPSTHLTTIGSRNRTFSINPNALWALQASVGVTLIGDCGTNVVGQYDFSTGIAQGFYLAGTDNVVRTIGNIADALTNAIRMNSGQFVQGSSSVVKTHIHVQWWWLGLPLVLVLLGIGFLGVTAWKTWKSNVPSWRMSALAVMEHGVNSSFTRHGGGGEENGGVERRLTYGSDGEITAAAGKEKISELEGWAEDVAVRLRRRGLRGREYGLTVI